MKKLKIQIQLERNSCVDESAIIGLLKNYDYDPDIKKGNDSGEYINISVKTGDLLTLWVKIKAYLKNNECLSQTSIITCEGSHGWDDYLLLHHFDTKEETDTI